MNVDTLVVAVPTVVAALVGSAGLSAIVQAFTGRKKSRADAADVLTDSVTGWGKELKEEATQARLRADALNASLDSTTAKVRSLSWELDIAFTKLRRWKAAIKNPQISRDQLVTMVEIDFPSTSTNGNTHNDGGL